MEIHIYVALKSLNADSVDDWQEIAQNFQATKRMFPTNNKIVPHDIELEHINQVATCAFMYE